MQRVLFATICVLAIGSAAERREPPTAAELAEISRRGQLLTEYDQASWQASDAVMLLSPEPGTIGRYIARRNDAGWTVAFGRLNETRDRFHIAYEAEREFGSTTFEVKKHNPPRPDTGFYLCAARGIELALGAFKPAANRPHNVAVLPAAGGAVYVYVMPAQTNDGVFPLGGDARYLVSPDGSKILESRQLHVAIIEFPSDPALKTQGGVHSAVLDDVPEDTDVFHVLVRRPSVPEWVGTKNFVYRIEVDGSIKYLMRADAVRRIGKK